MRERERERKSYCRNRKTETIKLLKPPLRHQQAAAPPAGRPPLQTRRSSMEQQRRNDQDRLQQDQRVKPPEAPQSHQPQPPPPQKCPRCDSSNTKFCYYNNYSLSQPRYFCKSCRRYWTHGGTLRNVPVGGGCRKSKRPKPSAPSASGGDIGRSSQPLSPSFPSQNMSSGQPMRPLPPIMGNTFYGGGGGSFLSSLAAMQSLSNGINQGATLNLGGGGGGGQFDANMALMQGATLQSLKSQLPPPPPSQFQLQNDQYFQSQQNLSLPPRPSLTSWTQNFINRGPPANTSTSAASSSFWSGAAADGENLAGSSFNPNHWQDSSNQGFDPSSDQ